MSFPIPVTFTSGQVVTAGQINTNGATALGYLLGNAGAPGSGMPLFIGRQTVAQTLTTGTPVGATLDTEDVDRDGGHSTSTNTSRYTAQTAGYYRAAGGASYTNAVITGFRLSRWAVNGSVLNYAGVQLQGPGAGAYLHPMPAASIFLNVSDFLELNLDQTSAANMATLVAAGQQTFMALQWVSMGPT